MEAIRLETRMPDNPFFAEYVIGIYNFLEIESSLLEFVQDLNFRLGNEKYNYINLTTALIKDGSDFFTITYLAQSVNRANKNWTHFGKMNYFKIIKI